MNIYFDHVDFNSFAGPHWFGQKLAKELIKKGHKINVLAPFFKNPDIQLSFVEVFEKNEGIPLIQRLDGIWYNTKTEYEKMNEPIKKTYDIADGVIFQSNFDRDFIFHHFGERENYSIIHNGADVEYIRSIPAARGLESYDNVWCCASSWINADGTMRHNKRLNENMRYFQEHSGEKDVLCVAGSIGKIENPDPSKVIFLGELKIDKLISLYKRSTWMIHMALQDHCPNVVVDARVSGCKIVCASSGGTPEIAGSDATIIVDENKHGFDAYDYNVPTTLDFSKQFQGAHKDVNISMDYVADQYLDFFGRLIK